MRVYRHSARQIARYFRHIALLGLIATASSGCTANGASCGVNGGSACQNCSAIQVDCNGDPSDGCEVNLSTDPSHCGSCDKVCPGISNQTALCRDSSCALCPSGRLNCNGAGSDGCEVKSSSDPSNCGGCGTVCPAVPGGVAGCLNGSCGIDRCNLGFSDCNGDPSDGCETNTQDDVRNCGNCNSVCPTLPGGPVACQGGTCVIGKCNPGYDSCTPNGPLQACETNLNTDVYNCGKCGSLCPATGPGTQRTCVSATCTATPCAAPWRDCNGQAADGCETDTSRDPSSCGGCGVTCTGLPNAATTCAASQCILTRCNKNFGDCNGKLMDGCEANLLIDVNHCGGCNISCAFTANASAVMCQSGQCTLTQCNSGFQDCDGLYNNGCEANLNSDPANCGACGKRCATAPHVQPQCSNMTCTPSGRCDAGYLDCDKNPANGCEISASNDPSNCGGCGVVCAAGQTCVNSACS